MTRPPLILPLLVLLLTLAAGCTGAGDEGPSATGPGPNRAAIRDGLAQLFAGDHPTDQDRADGDCFARQLVVRATPTQLRDAGVLEPTYAVVENLPPLPQAMAESWADAQRACVDFVEASARAQVKVTHGAIDAEGYVACLRGALSEDQLRAARVDALEGDFEATTVRAFSDAQTSCAQQSLGR